MYWFDSFEPFLKQANTAIYLYVLAYIAIYRDILPLSCSSIYQYILLAIFDQKYVPVYTSIWRYRKIFEKSFWYILVYGGRYHSMVPTAMY